MVVVHYKFLKIRGVKTFIHFRIIRPESRGPHGALGGLICTLRKKQNQVFQN